MKTFDVKNMTIEVDDGNWRLVTNTDNFMPTLILEAKNGSGVMRYRGDYAELVGLPGDSMSTGYIHAIVVGYKSTDLQWLLGLHVADDPEKKPRWVQLCSWNKAPNTRYAAEAQEAGRILAEFVGCPLKIFGVKKMPNVAHTGPLEHHDRQDIDRDTVEFRASKMVYPGDHLDMKLEERDNNGIALKVGKNAASAVKDSPPYHNIEIDTRRETIKMFPPTGLLGAFLGGARGREIPFKMVRNVEFRYIVRYDSTMAADDTDDNMLTEQSTVTFEWHVYLTIPNESILLAATTHQTSSELTRTRATKGNTERLNYTDNVTYYRKLEEDQEARETARVWAERAAYIIASTIGCRLVETQVGAEIK
jgi:hypothetical protein